MLFGTLYMMSDVPVVHKCLMLKALREARRALHNAEVPVGAVVVVDEVIVGRGHNQRQTLSDPTVHAEVLAIRQAAQYLGQWQLTTETWYVTLEPCSVCRVATGLRGIG